MTLDQVVKRLWMWVRVRHRRSTVTTLGWCARGPIGGDSVSRACGLVIAPWECAACSLASKLA